MASTSSQWENLFNEAVSLIRQAETLHGVKINWSFGGGTALMTQIWHRESYDVDIFVDDPDIVRLLNPETNDYSLSINHGAYDLSGHHALKISFDPVGEIDFICAAHVLNQPIREMPILGRQVAVDTPFEIIAKKLQYRGASLQARDLFDLAAVAQACGSDALIGALAEASVRPKEALSCARQMKPEFATEIIRGLNILKDFDDLAASSRDITIEVLARATGEHMPTG